MPINKDMKVKAVKNQSLIDIAIQTGGKLECVFELAMANNMSITDELQPGDELEIPDYTDPVPEIVDHFKNHNIAPVTALSPEDFALIESSNDCKLCKCFK